MQKILKKQGAISSIMTFLLLGLTFLLVSAQIKILGVEHYGMLVLLLSVFGTVNLINMGIGSSLVSYYTKHESKDIFWNLYLWIFIIFSVLAFIVVILGSLFYKEIFNVLSLGNHNLNIFAYFGAGIIGISRLLSTIVGIYWAVTVNFLLLRIFDFLSFNISLFSIIILYPIRDNFNEVLFISSIINLVAIIVTFICVMYFRSGIENLRPDKKEFKSLFITSLEFQGISIVSSLARPLLNTLINTKLGLNYTTYFDIAIRLLTAGRQVIVAATAPFFSVMTQLNNKNKKRYMYLLIKKYTFYNMVAAVIFLAGTYIFSYFILSIWVGKEMADNTIYLVKIISIGITFNISSAVIYNSFLSFRSGRLHVFIHQFILVAATVIMMLLNFTDANELAMYYSLSLFIGAIYLFIVFRRLNIR